MYLAPHMRRVLIDERLRRVAHEQLRDDKQADLLLLAVERLLEDVAPVAIGREVDDAAAAER